MLRPTAPIAVPAVVLAALLLTGVGLGIACSKEQGRAIRTAVDVAAEACVATHAGAVLVTEEKTGEVLAIVCAGAEIARPIVDRLATGRDAGVPDGGISDAPDAD